VRNLGLSYALAIIGLFGLAGIHRFYLGKPVTGLLWLLTGGLFGIGTIYDLITMQTQVDTTNRDALAASQAAGALPAAPGYGYAYAYGAGPTAYPTAQYTQYQQYQQYQQYTQYPQYQYPQEHQPATHAAPSVTHESAHPTTAVWHAAPMFPAALELRVLQLARSHDGRVTAPLAAAELGVSIAQADEKLTEIAKAGHANVDIDADGVVIYDFPALRLS
jgi:hypothetical protein